MRLNDGLRLADLGGRKADVDGQVYCRREPKLCLPIRVGHMDMNARFFPREEEQTELSVADYGWRHWANVADLTGPRDHGTGGGI